MVISLWARKLISINKYFTFSVCQPHRYRDVTISVLAEITRQPITNNQLGQVTTYNTNTEVCCHNALHSEHEAYQPKETICAVSLPA